MSTWAWAGGVAGTRTRATAPPAPSSATSAPSARAPRQRLPRRPTQPPPKSGGARLGGAPRITREAEFAAPSRAVRLYATQVLAGVPGGDAAVLHLTAETEGERVRPSSSVILTLSFLLAFPSGKIWCLLVLLSALSFRG